MIDMSVVEVEDNLQQIHASVQKIMQGTSACVHWLAEVVRFSRAITNLRNARHCTIADVVNLVMDASEETTACVVFCHLYELHIRDNKGIKGQWNKFLLRRLMGLQRLRIAAETLCMRPSA